MIVKLLRKKTTPRCSNQMGEQGQSMWRPAAATFLPLRQLCFCRYDILHKQKVSAEDVYLGASERDPSSAFCDELVVVVELPAEVGKDIDLDVTRQRFVLQAKKQYVSSTLFILRAHSSMRAVNWPFTCLTL